MRKSSIVWRLSVSSSYKLVDTHPWQSFHHETWSVHRAAVKWPLLLLSPAPELQWANKSNMRNESYHPPKQEIATLQNLCYPATWHSRYQGERMCCWRGWLIHRSHGISNCGTGSLNVRPGKLDLQLSISVRFIWDLLPQLSLLPF